MLSMGLTLTFDDFRKCMRNPWTVSHFSSTIGSLTGEFIGFSLLCYYLMLFFIFQGWCGLSCTIPCETLVGLRYCYGTIVNTLLTFVEFFMQI